MNSHKKASVSMAITWALGLIYYAINIKHTGSAEFFGMMFYTALVTGITLFVFIFPVIGYFDKFLNYHFLIKFIFPVIISTYAYIVMMIIFSLLFVRDFSFFIESFTEPIRVGVLASAYGFCWGILYIIFGRFNLLPQRV